MPKFEPRYIPIEQASTYLSVDKKTIRRMIARGDLTGYRAGPRLIRVDLNEVDALLRPIPTAGGARAAR
jgi:excisionase family DNA binding protein